MLAYHRQYPIMGQGRVMVTKVVWDFTMYWGGIALLFFHDKFRDAAFMSRVQPLLQGFAQHNVAVQACFREWAGKEDGREPSGGFVDYAELSFLADLNRELLCGFDDEALFAKLEANLALARDLREEILAVAGRAGPAPTTHLDGLFAAF